MMNRPAKAALATLLVLAMTGCVSSATRPNQNAGQMAQQAEPVDLLITGGDVYDGDGTQLPNVDIVVDDGHIVEISAGLAGTIRAKQTIDARGLVVSPGFIDPHTHADSDLTSQTGEWRANLPYAFQGVTTVIVGNDGQGLADPRNAISIQPTGTNFAFLSGFGDVRRAVLGAEDRAPTNDELAQMKELVRQDFCAGAHGFSTGLYYTPQSFADTPEVIALAKVAASFGGYYDTHMRDESDFSIGVLAAVDEALQIGREAQIPVHIAHIKALGPAVWGQSKAMIARVNAARANGQRVTADQYPWQASGTRISNALVPGWALDGGLVSLRKRLANQDVRARIAQGIAANIERRGGPESLLITGALGIDTDIEGKTLGKLAQLAEMEPQEVAMLILTKGDARLASFNMNDADMAAFAAQEWVMTGSDGSNGHPRKYATYPKAYRDWVASGKYDMGWFIRRSSGAPAKTIGLLDRGFLREGFAADIVIFDPASFAPVATYRSPKQLSHGVKWLIVNGEPVIAGGEYSGALAGLLLRKAQPAERCKTHQAVNP